MADLFAGLSISNSPTAKNAAPVAMNGDAATSVQPPLSSPTNRSNHSNPPPAMPAASPISGERVRSAPVTDKLLGLLSDDRPSSNGPAGVPLSTATTSSSSAPPAIGSVAFAPSANHGPPKKRSSKAVVVGTETKTVPSSSPKMPSTDLSDEDILAAFSMESKEEIRVPPLSPPTSSYVTTSPNNNNDDDNNTIGGAKPAHTGRISAPPPPLGDPTTDANLKRHSLRGVGVIKEDTPIPNADVALRVFRKFVNKTKQHVPETHGGTQQLSLWERYVSGTPAEYDTRFDAYLQFVTVLGMINEETASTAATAESPRSDDAVIDSVLGASGDTMAKARQATASFCHLLSVWSHVSAHVDREKKSSADHQVFCGMIAVGYDTATSLVTYGCLDGVMVGIGPDKNEYHKVVEVLAESVFSSDMSQAATELAVMKFLLSTGCRASSTDGCAMLRGSHLLQTIRVLYHVYLSTDTEANKTTARASLQQLVTSVFIRMILTQTTSNDNNTSNPKPSETGESEPNFPSDNHRDAFLVLRSLCKLSMRNPPIRANHSTNTSNPTWDASKDGQVAIPAGSVHSKDKESIQHVVTATHAIHPALESKILALDLLLYVLNNTDMKDDFLQQCGPQFHYAIRNYLCVSLLKNCTSDDTRVVNLSLRVFVPIFQNFRSILKTEIEAFVTNVFFVILDSKNSPVEHKILVVTLFDEICSDPTTLAEIFLNYDCDLSAVDLFHRIVNTLSKVARSAEQDDPNANSTISLVAGTGAARMEKSRSQYRELRLNGMRALRQVLASLNASIIEPMRKENQSEGNDREINPEKPPSKPEHLESSNGESKKSLVEIYGSKKKRREEKAEVILRFNQKPKAGIAYAAKCGHVDPSDPADVARFLLENKDVFEKTQIGEYLGREPDYEEGFSIKVLHEYAQLMDFEGLVFDDAIRLYLSGFRLPGEAQKIDRIMEKFAEHYTEQNPLSFASADVAFILSFSIIMLNTDLHNPAIKEERRMTKEGFIRNNRGISDGQDLPQEVLTEIFDRIKENPISLKEDDEARERVGDSGAGTNNALSPAVFFTNHHHEVEKTKESNFNKERDQIVRTTESLLKRRRHSTVEAGKGSQRRIRSQTSSSKSHTVRYVRTADSGLRDEYVAPMFEVTWGPALAAFSTAMESANGTVGALLAIATEEELEAAAVNAAETIEVCLTGFRFAICTAGLVGNDVARDSYMLALSRFSQLGTGVLLEPRHVRCIQTMLALARSDGELLGDSWEHVFRALSEINRFHNLFQLMARNDRAIANAAERRKMRLTARERRQEERRRRLAARENSESLDDSSLGSLGASSDDISYDESSLFDDSDDFDFKDDMDTKEIDEANARTVYEAVSEEVIEAIYERSSSMSTEAVKVFVLQLCRVSRMEISHYGGHVGSDSNQVDLTKVQYRRQHELLAHAPSKEGEGGFHHHQTNIYNLQKLVEVTHYNMDSRPRLVFAEIWTTVSAHLTSTALHTNPAVAMYAVDSFRQLYIQYLQREELGVFEFQRKFLKPLETIMARSEISTTKELLLKCVDRIILMFGSPQREGKGGMLRSGWRPVLTVLGLAGRDQDEEIAKMGFEMMNAQIKECLKQCADDKDGANSQGVLLIERFVDLVDALLMYVEGPHEEMSLLCIDNLLKLCDFLADESTVSPLVKKRRNTVSIGPENDTNKDEAAKNEELELWWPILLGLSRSVGDERKGVRRKGLESLMQIVLKHFFTGHEDKEKQIQTLQLVFRGIFTPILEFGDADARDAKTPELPSDFDRFLTGPKVGDPPKLPPSGPSPCWVDNTFDQFIDGCIQICLRSIDKLNDDTLVEEIFAMLNNCLVSDSGAMAVKGLRRLELFVTSDLRTTSISDDTWATLSHMLRRCLVVRGFPRRSSTTSLNGSSHSGDPPEDTNKDETELNSEVEQADQEAIREFVAEDSMFPDRRYIGGNTIAVIGKFLESERFAKSLGLRWRLFLMSGVAKGIREWENAAELLYKNKDKMKIPKNQNPPSYLETAYYGRKWMNRFLLQISAMKDVIGPAPEGSRPAAAQALLMEQTQSLVSLFLEKEALVGGDGKKLVLDIKLFEKLTVIVKDMLAGYSKLPEDHVRQFPWLSSILTSCMTTGNEDVQIAIQKLGKRLQQ
ncbi:RalF-like Dot/Icm system translocated protein [Nitzschia inconspicua]|uniref:RalF-like Dot/Icm system translocated protein n=1 Tax=Nitzschia inconspicua TaxID=303405 RepID=A0A9K3LUT5_9STRA|nr:RalF-like Dot/Icm system translocated protein [Nitzschia inconspicua]